MLNLFHYIFQKFATRAASPHARHLQMFKRRQTAQMANKRMDAFFPVSDSAVFASDAAFGATYRSQGFACVRGFQERVAPIIYLYSASKAMFLLHCENGNSPVGASETFDHVSQELIDILDAAIEAVPTDLLVLISQDTLSDLVRNLRSARMPEEIASFATRDELDESRHSLVRLKAHLLRLHCAGMSKADFIAFRRAILALENIGLFQDEIVSPLAVDFFPSLADREKELALRRAELQWRPETSDDPVVVIPTSP